MRKLAYTMETASLDMGGENYSSMASEVCMDKGICKSWTVRSPGSAKVQAKKEIYNVCVQFTCWSLCVDRCSAGLDSSFTLTGSAKVQAKKEHSIMAIAC